VTQRRTIAGLSCAEWHPSAGAVPVHLLAAGHAGHDEARPMLSDAALARAVAVVPRLTTERVEANHLTLPAAPQLAAATSSALP
jgi:lipase